MPVSPAVPSVSERFPLYTEFDPLVPIRCVTPDLHGCIHRFFDTSPISPSGRYLAAFALPFENRGPQPGEAGSVVLVDLQSGEQKRVADTRGWEPQMGANLNWGGNDETLFLNDVDPKTWDAFAVKLNPHTGEARRLDGPVYHASPDGRYLAASNPKAMRRTQGGYGVVVPDDHIPRFTDTREDEGVWLTDTQTGQTKMIVSLAELMRVADSPKFAEAGGHDGVECYGFHSKFSPCGRRLLFTTRWCKHEPEPVIGLHGGRKDLRYTVFTMDLNRDTPEADGFPKVENLCATIGDEQWEKHGHHVNWEPDGNGLSANLALHRDEMRFVRCELDGSGLREVCEGVVGSGHPSIHPTAGHFVTDTYVFESLAFDDGTTPLRWVDMKTGQDRRVARYTSRTPHQAQDGTLRLDPHPAWDRTWTHVAFNTFLNGTRRVMVADMRPLFDG
ncbi:MAG: hypothetical protein AAGF84_12555 [Planctomycetota bacterium]